MEKKAKIPVYLTWDLYEEIKRRVKLSQGEFKSVEQYVDFVLRGIIDEEKDGSEAYTPKEEREIKEKLKRLGYL